MKNRYNPDYKLCKKCQKIFGDFTLEYQKCYVELENKYKKLQIRFKKIKDGGKK